MEWILELDFARWIPLLAVLAGVSAVLAAANWIATRRARWVGAEPSFGRPLLMLALTGIGAVLVILALPLEDEGTRGQLLSLLGLVLTAIIALSSTTVVANAMAGLVLRAMRNFRPGDFVRVGGQLGRVTERGLFHTEIQTEDRDLTTLPNLYLVTQPVTVVHATGTVMSASLSLGYDVPRQRVEELLVQAAETAELQEPFVQVLELGDFSVTYRVAGLLQEVKELLSARSRLRKCVLDALHGAGIEIVSPTFMNQRVLGEDRRILPPSGKRARPAAEEPGPEAVIFDKAERAAAREALRAEREKLAGEIESLEATRKQAEAAERAGIDDAIAERRARIEALAADLASDEPEPEPEA